MASPAGNAGQQALFDMHKLFKPPTPTPSPNPSGQTPFPPTSSYPAPAAPSYPSPPTAPSYPSPPTGPFSYPPSTPPFHHHAFLHYPQEPLHRPAVSYPVPPPYLPGPSPNPSPGPNHGARLMALLGTPTPTPSSLESAASMSPPSPMPPAPSTMPPAPSPSSNELLTILPSAPLAILAPVPQPPPARLPSSKMPRGRHLGSGDRAVYDVESRLPGESQPPQLEVTPITKYISDPGLVLGRQIAVNQRYICYGLKLGNIRVLNINTALRALLRGHSQRVTDMAFFAEDVHLLASASVDGRIYVWKIDEGPDEENKPQITGKIVIAIQIVGDGESYHPRICWHSHKQEILVVGVGNCVLKVDTTKVGRGKEFSAEEPLKCPIEKLIDGMQLVGQHNGEVTDLSISQWMTTRLVSASKDGTVKIWEDRKATPLMTLRPHDGQPVNSVEFLTSPNCPDHIVLITAGPLIREVKIWASASEEGWLLPSDSESWRCTQTLELRSSAELQYEEAFFNQVVVLPRASLILLANAKKNAIYAVHVDYGSCPASSRMDYIADFTVAMPILSLTGTSACFPDGEQVVQVYCVQTQAIQQYALDLSQCLPPPNDNVLSGKDSCIPRDFDTTCSERFDVLESSRGPNVSEPPLNSASPNPTLPLSSSQSSPASVHIIPLSSSDIISVHELTTSDAETKPSAPPLSGLNADSAHVSSFSPLNLDLSGNISALKSPSKGFEQGHSVGDHDVDQPVLDFMANKRSNTATTNDTDAPSIDDNSGKDESKAVMNGIPIIPNSHLMFKLDDNSAHLITPAEIMSGAISSSESTLVNQGLEEGKVQDVIINDDVQSAELEVKVAGERRSNQHEELEFQKQSRAVAEECKEKSLSSQTSEPKDEMSKECCLLTKGTSSGEEAFPVDDITVAEASERPSNTGEEEAQDSMKDMTENVTESAVNIASKSFSGAKGNKQKAKQSQTSGPSSPLSPFNSTDSSNEPGSSTSAPLTDAAFSQILAMQEMLNQLVTMQKELQKQLSVMVAVNVTKEGKRVEAALGRSMEKSVKANVDALWARLQEENAKHEKAERDLVQQITSLITNGINKDLPSILERVLKKELSTVGPSLARAVTPIIEKPISSAIADSFQRGVGDKAVNQLEKSVNSKLEATMSRQIQAQFQTSGKQALQDALRSSLESSLIPAFELSCRAMFEKLDSALQKGITEYTSSAQQQLESTHTPLALALRDAITSASSITQNMTSELADGQHKILVVLAAGNLKAFSPVTMQQGNGPMTGRPETVETPLDPTKELARLISECKYDEAFTLALQRSDVSIVSWLCSQVDLHGICSMVPLPLSQGVLLALLQQLACDIGNDTSRKLGWMTTVAVAINPTDPMITLHVRPILEQVYNILAAHQRSTPTASATDIRAIMHVINSVLMSCK